MDESRERSDEELARAAQGGDPDAFDDLARRYLRPAFALGWQFVRTIEDVEDVVQEAFHRAVRALRDYDPDRPFAPWFYAIVRNVARSHAGRAARRAVLAPSSPLGDDDAVARRVDPALSRDVERGLAGLPPMQRASIRLCDIEGFTSVEAARMLGLHEGTIRTHLHRGRQALRTAVGAKGSILR